MQIERENLIHAVDVLENELLKEGILLGKTQEEIVQILWSALVDSLQEDPPF